VAAAAAVAGAAGVTQRAGDEFDLADRALDQGYDTIVAVGGDGTWSHVADRVVASGRDDVRFGVLPSGTGNDFGRSFGLKYRDPASAVRALATGGTIAVDVGRVVTPSAPGVPGDAERTTGPSRVRHFLNLIGLGFDIAVIDAAAGARFLRGELLYKWTALTQLVRYPGIDLSLTDGDAFTTLVDGKHDASLGRGVSVREARTGKSGLDAIERCLIRGLATHGDLPQ